MGVVDVCDSAAQLGAECSKQSDCSTGELCLVTIGPSTLKAVYRCGKLPSNSAEGAFCLLGSECATGLLCANGACSRPCPGGKTDCPGVLQCGVGILHGGTSSASSDDVTAPVCTL